MTPIYERSVWRLIIDGVEAMQPVFTTADMVRWFANNYPKVNSGTVQLHLRAACVNLPVDATFRSNRPERLVLYRTGRAQYTRYLKDVHGRFDDHGRLVGAATDPDQDGEATFAEVPTEDDYAPTEAATEFALESHLEEFIDANWNRINFGVPLEVLAEDGLKIGRQYRTDVGVIDFLCRDRSTERYWVIELKRGETSDRTVGQLLRYMGWVKRHLSEGTEVHGLVIAHEQDDRLRYAVEMVPNVEAWTYKINFEFNRESVAV